MNKTIFVYIAIIGVSAIAVWQITSILQNDAFSNSNEKQTLDNEVNAIENKYQLDCDHIMTGVQVCNQLQPILSDIDKRLTVLENKTHD